MIAEVVFPLAHPEPFFYAVPSGFCVRPGIRVVADLKGRKRVGFVVGLRESVELPAEKLKKLESLLDSAPIISEKLLELIRWVSQYYKEPLGVVFSAAVPPYIREGKSIPKEHGLLALKLKKTEVKDLTPRQKDLLEILKREGMVFITDLEKIWGISRSVAYALVEKGVAELLRRPKTPVATLEEEIELTSEQLKAVEAVVSSFFEFKRFLLYGVTGSGKTEVYKRCAAEAVEKGKGVLILVPEIALTPHYVKRFASVFGEKLAVLHSALSPKERAFQWERIRSGEAMVVVGTRSAVFSPIPSCGLIVVDEEHDHSYKQADSPRYNARDVAVVRARLENCPVILGSATPSVESYFNAKTNRYVLITLRKRVKGGCLPAVVFVDMKKEKGILSARLTEEIRKRLSKGEAAMLLLNKKGYFRSVVCRTCGKTVFCPNCDVALTPYKREGGFLFVCHLCGYETEAVVSCPSCGGHELFMTGYGLQRVEEELKKLFPGATVERMDRESVTSKYTYWQLVERMEKGEIDILIGTQMIAKGHHFPRVTLSALLLADLGLQIPDFRASERVFQLICQMAGRAGREKPGLVVIQSFNPDFYAVRYGAVCDVESFMKVELEARKTFRYPPFWFLARIIFVGGSEEKVKQAALYIKEKLKDFPVELLGPSACGLRKVLNKYRWHIVLRAEKRIEIQKALEAVPQSLGSVRILKDVDPYDLS